MAHELGHLVYRDHQRKELLYTSTFSIVLFLLLMVVVIVNGNTIVVSPISIATSLLGVISTSLATVYVLRAGEFYADAFAAELISRKSVLEELDILRKRERYIKRDLLYRVSHPSFNYRYDIAAGTANIIGPCILSLFLSVVQIWYLIDVIPDVVFGPALFIGTISVLFAGQIGILIASCFVILLLGWCTFLLLAPTCYLCCEALLYRPKRTIIICLLIYALVVVAEIALLFRHHTTIRQTGDQFQDFDRNMWIYWFGVIALSWTFAVVGGFVIALIEKRRGYSVKLRRGVVEAGCAGVLLVASLYAYTVETDPIVSTIVLGGLIGSLAMVVFQLWTAWSNWGQEFKPTSWEAIRDEVLLFFVDVGLVRFVERLSFVIILWLPVVGLQNIIYELINPSAYIALLLVVPWQLDRWALKYQRGERRVTELCSEMRRDWLRAE